MKTQKTMESGAIITTRNVTAVIAGLICPLARHGRTRLVAVPSLHVKQKSLMLLAAGC